MKRSDLISILHGDINHLNHVSQYSDYSDTPVEIYPKDVKDILNKYLYAEITKNDLIKWAQFIDPPVTFYCAPGDPEDDEINDWYVDMWDVISRISTYFIDGEITPELVKKYLSQLEKYDD